MKKIFFIAAVIFVMNFAPRVFANQIIPGGQLEAMAIAEVESLLEIGGEFRRHEIVMQRPLSDISLPNGVLDVKIMIPSATVNYTGVTPVKARIFLGGRMYRDVNFVVVVKIFDSALVASHDLRIEFPVTAADFHIEEIPVNGRTDYLVDASEIIGLVPHRLIRAGTPVTASYFQQPVAVTTGQPVRILLRYRGIEISANGISMARGRIGDVIKVKNASSQKILAAKVIDSQTVEVSI